MKKIYILMGHPNTDPTLTSSMADAYEKAARAAGHEVRRANIGELSFDPILHKGYKVIQELEPDLKKVQEDMKWADHLVLLYPLWWSATPALLKGMFDRMWLPGFCFRFNKHNMGWKKLLHGKTARVVCLSNLNPHFIRILFGDFTNEVGHATLGFAGYKVRFTEIGNAEHLSDGAKAAWFKRMATLGAAGK